MGKIKEFLYGYNVISAALSCNKRQFIKLLTNDTTKHSQVLNLAKQKMIDIEQVSKPTLDRMAMDRPHQGLVLEAYSLPTEKVLCLEPVEEKPLWLALDQIVDPQNLGSILRTCHFFGVDGVVITENASSPLTPIVSKASSGAMEIMNIYTTSNLVKFLQKSKQNGWIIYGTDINQEDVIQIPPLKPDGQGLHFAPSILVLGNEGKGLRSQVAKQCHQHLFIPGQESLVDSLNVGVATGILLYELLKH